MRVTVKNQNPTRPNRQRWFSAMAALVLPVGLAVMSTPNIAFGAPTAEQAVPAVWSLPGMTPVPGTSWPTFLACSGTTTTTYDPPITATPQSIRIVEAGTFLCYRTDGPLTPITATLAATGSSEDLSCSAGTVVLKATLVSQGAKPEGNVLADWTSRTFYSIQAPTPIEISIGTAAKGTFAGKTVRYGSIAATQPPGGGCPDGMITEKTSNAVILLTAI